MKEKTKKRWLLAYLILVNAFSVLATDMYLPALPSMSEQLNAPVAIVNLTLSLYFIFFAGSMLIWGTVSDKYGRRPTLLVGAGAFLIASILCSLSTNVYMLILFRIIQGIGSGAGVCVSMAIMKDVFEGKERERALAFANIFFAVGPIVAPVLGALILKIMPWRGIFISLVGFGIIAFIGTIIMKETAPDNRTKSLISTLSNLPKVLTNTRFTILLILFSLLSVPWLTWLGAASNIYITGFGLSEQSFSLFFAFNAMFIALGPIIFIILSKKNIGASKIITAGLIMTLLCGVLVVLFGNKSPYHFALTVLPATIGIAMMRPPSANLLLEQVKKNAGAASSLMTFSNLFMGTLGMQFISLDWDNRIYVYGLIHITIGLICLVSWPVIWKKMNATESSQLTSHEDPVIH